MSTLTKTPTPIKALTFAALLIFTLVVVLPFLLTISTSLKTMAEIQSPTFKALPGEWQWTNYVQAMQNGNWGRYFLNSFIVTAITVVLSLWFNSMTGFGFARLHFRGRGVLFALLLVGLMVPEQVTLVPLFSMMADFPLFGGNNILGEGGRGLINTYGGLIIPFLAAPFGIFLCRQFYLTFPRALDDAATIDGASKIRTYFQIYVPLSGPLLAALGALKTTHTWNNYLWPLVMVNTDEMFTVQLGLTRFSGEFGVQWNQLMAATVLVIAPLVIGFLAAQKYFVSGLVTTGLKG